MAVKINLETAVRLVEEAVASKPEGYVYVNNRGEQARVGDHGDPAVGCDYFTPEGEGSCIVGHVILAAGVDFYSANGMTSSFARTYLEDLEGREVIEVDVVAVDFLAKVQYHQDRGTTWAEALEQAKKGVAKHL